MMQEFQADQLKLGLPHSSAECTALGLLGRRARSLETMS